MKNSFMKIVLLGYMASGKSAVGKILARNLNMQFVDLDSYIEGKEGLSILEIFENHGEIYFRIKEAKYLLELLNLEKKCIISLGGGTPCYGNSMNLIIEKSISIYLNASINTIFERLSGETTQRPLVATIGKENLKEYIGKHLFERNVFYQQAKHVIAVNDKLIPQVASEITELL